MPRRPGLLASIVVATIALAGCAAPADRATVTLDDVAAERSERLVGMWLSAAAETELGLRAEFPDAPDLEFRFVEWVEPGDYLATVQRCLTETLGRDAFLGGDAEPGEDAWAPAVAEASCRLAYPPFTSEFTFRGDLERRWLVDQLSRVLPACVRGFGGRLELGSMRELVDRVWDRRPSDEAPRDIWSIVSVQGITPLDLEAIRRTCPDPGLALDALPLPEIDR